MFLILFFNTIGLHFTMIIDPIMHETPAMINGTIQTDGSVVDWAESLKYPAK